MARNQSTSAADDPARQVRFLSRALQINPIDQAETLMQLRQTYYGWKNDRPQAFASNDDLQERRQKVVDLIQRVREQFWKADLAKLQQGLAKLKVDDFPDLKHAVRRLQIVAQYRDRMPKLAESPDFNSEFFRAMKSVLVQSPREAVAAKEDLLQALRGREQKSIQKMAQLVTTSLPALYEMEADWFDSIASYQPVKRKKASIDSGDGSGWTDGMGWIIWVLIFIGLRALRYALRD
ncbi:MAG: hypothetical protein R3C01_10980 [Planctomycetaceae bacterium]